MKIFVALKKMTCPCNEFRHTNRTIPSSHCWVTHPSWVTSEITSELQQSHPHNILHVNAALFSILKHMLSHHTEQQTLQQCREKTGRERILLCSHTCFSLLIVLLRSSLSFSISFTCCLTASTSAALAWMEEVKSRSS